MNGYDYRNEKVRCPAHGKIVDAAVIKVTEKGYSGTLQSVNTCTDQMQGNKNGHVTMLQLMSYDEATRKLRRHNSRATTKLHAPFSSTLLVLAVHGCSCEKLLSRTL